MINHSPYLGPHCVQLTQWIECAPFEKLLGIEIILAQKGQATLTMPFRAEFANGGNLLHGGALVSLADTAAVMAIEDEKQRIVMTMNATFKISKRPIQPCEPR